MPKDADINADLIDTLIDDWTRERPDIDPSAMGVVGRILHLGRRLEARAAKALKPYGLYYRDLDVLATLRRTGAPFELTPSDLMNSVLITSGAMTTCLGRLESAGLIKRVVSDKDRRVRLITLTARGKSLVDEAICVRFADAEASIAALSDDDRESLADLLRKLTHL